MNAFDPNIVTIAALIGGYILARWDKRGDKQDAIGMDALTIGVRLRSVEDWIGRHQDIGAAHAGLAEQMKSLAKAVERMAERFDEWIDQPPPPARRSRSN